jgi:hypothetical protein
MNHLKICTNCKVEKDLNSFGKSKRTKDERQQQCKTCTNLKKAILNSKRIIPIHNEFDVKICTSCKVEKPFNLFSDCLSHPDGKMYNCKECRKKYHAPRKEGVKIFTERQERLCTKCNEIKPFSDFGANKKANCGVSNMCKSCAFKYRQSTKLQPKEIPDFKTCTRCNTEKEITYFVKDISKKDGIASRCKRCTNELRTNRCSRDITFKMSNSIRSSITTSFTSCAKGLFVKNSKTEDILGIPFPKMKEIVASQFLNWMSWDKYGNCENGSYSCSWDLDHIIPISYAKTEEEIYLLNHWSNFQPLCSRINRIDKRANFYPCTNLELRITFWEDHYEYI